MNHPVRLLGSLTEDWCVRHLVSVEGEELVKLYWSILILDLIRDHLTKASGIEFVLIFSLRVYLGTSVSLLYLSHEVVLLGADDR